MKNQIQVYNSIISSNFLLQSHIFISREISLKNNQKYCNVHNYK